MVATETIESTETSQVVRIVTPNRCRSTLLVGPDQVGVEDLVVADDGERQHRQQQDQQDHHLPFARGNRTARGRWSVFAPARRIRRKPAAAAQIDHQRDQHADAGGPESVVPGDLLAERSGHQRGYDDPGVDAQVEDLEGVGAAFVALGVERADLGRDVALEAPRTYHQAKQRDQERTVKSHEEVAQRHEACAQDDRARPSQHTSRPAGRRGSASDRPGPRRGRRSPRPGPRSSSAGRGRR